MNLIKKSVLTVSLLSALCVVSVSAANNVSEIDIDVSIRDDGSAYVVQNWSGSFYEGTENYIPIATGDIFVSDFSVSDQNGKYTLISDWDINASLDEKARKCGINETSDGVELCFGISEYGENRYAVEYVIEDFIKSYNDFDGTNFMFINPDMSTFPTDGHINIVLENGTALVEGNSAIWAFGYDGNIEFQNGAVSAYTTRKLSGDDSMIVMLRLNKGLISPKAEIDTSFDAVTDRAFEGSDYGFDDYDYSYEDDDILATIIGFAVLLCIFGGAVLIITYLVKRKKEIKQFYKETGYFRDVPNDGKIDISYYLARNFDIANEESLIIGALILSMINKGSLEPQLEESVGFFGKVKESVNLKLKSLPDTASELSLFNLLSAAAGEDGILQEKELERYSYKYPENINNFIDGIRQSGENGFISLGGFSGRAGNRIGDLSEKGKSELAEIMGLEKFLKDFTLIAERGIAEITIWKEYLIYATLFGIGEKVLTQLEKVYPEKLPEIESYNRNVVIASGYCRSMYMSSQRAIQARRTDGGGGRASFGGGGGFSGGGRGGGSR